MPLSPQRRLAAPDAANAPYREVCAVWFARLLELPRLGETRSARVLRDDDCRFLLGLADSAASWDYDEKPADERSQSRLRARVKSLLRQAPTLQGTPLATNLAWLGARLDLSALEQELVAIAVLMHGYRPFGAAIAALRLSATTPTACGILTAMTQQSEVDPVYTALHREGTLPNSGLVRLTDDIVDFEDTLQLADGFANIMLSHHAGEAQLLAHFFRGAAAGTLGEADFPHLADDLDLLQRYLAKCLARGHAGVNILVHGEPGVGKTEFAKLLAARVGATLYEVSHADAQGASIGGEARLSAYQLCQRILARGGDALVLFDEIEDVFPSDFPAFLALLGAGRSSAAAGKAWINRTLESNAVPAIWISNDVEQIDPAYRRRFDYALEIPRPPLAVRQRIAAKHLDTAGVSAQWIRRIAAWSALTPAQLEKAARVTGAIAPQHADEAQAIAERVLRASARLLGQGDAPRQQPVADYRLEYLNTSTEVHTLIAAFQRQPVGSACFYGPPGTGKSALGRHIADAIGRPLMLRRASDLLDKYVGESEKAIARMFREAAHEGAVLVLDEADGLLAERGAATYSWQLTQVNEMLAGMEAFEGIFICATNLLARLDAASLRRFAFKLRFDFLRAEQRQALFLEFWQGLNPAAGPLDDLTVRRLAQLDTLTPGDFAAVARQWAMLGEAPSAAQLAAALEAECALKAEAARRRGT